MLAKTRLDCNIVASAIEVSRSPPARQGGSSASAALIHFPCLQRGLESQLGVIAKTKGSSRPCFEWSVRGYSTFGLIDSNRSSTVLTVSNNRDRRQKQMASWMRKRKTADKLRRLVLPNLSPEDWAWAQKAALSVAGLLVKHHRQDQLDELEKALVSHGSEPTSCVLLPRAMDGRTQLAYKKGPPHVMTFRMWRSTNVRTSDELTALECCEFAFHMRKENVCVNPYHYQLTLTESREGKHNELCSSRTGTFVTSNCLNVRRFLPLPVLFNSIISAAFNWIRMGDQLKWRCALHSVLSVSWTLRTFEE